MVLLLADGAVERGAIGEDDALDGGTADDARLARAVVCAKTSDECAFSAARVAIIADRRTPCVDRFLEHRTQCIAQGGRLPATECTGSTGRSYSGTEQGFDCVDVA